MGQFTANNFLNCRLKIHYTVDRAPPGWQYSVGFVNLEMCQENLFEHNPGTVTLLCGPPPMLKFACYPNLEKMGFEKGLNVIEF
jgi:NAD(P)H-flavin reductase